MRPPPFKNLIDAVIQKKESWWLGLLEGRATLMVGAAKRIKVEHGYIVAIGMTDDELRALRTSIDEHLGASATDPAPPPSLTPKRLGEN